MKAKGVRFSRRISDCIEGKDWHRVAEDYCSIWNRLTPSLMCAIAIMGWWPRELDACVDSRLVERSNALLNAWTRYRSLEAYVESVMKDAIAIQSFPLA